MLLDEVLTSFFKRKNHPGRWLFRRLVNPGRFANRGNSLVRDMSPNLSFQCSLSSATTSRTLRTSLAHLCYQWLPPVAICRVFQGWNQENSYLKRRGSRVERGVRAYSPAWSEPPTRNPVARVGMRKRHLTADSNG